MLEPPVLFAGTIRSPGFLPFPTINRDLLSAGGRSPLYTVKVTFHIVRHGTLNKCDLCKGTKEPGEVSGLAGVTDRPLEVCTSSVIRVEVAGQMQFRANMAYLNSSSHTT